MGQDLLDEGVELAAELPGRKADDERLHPGLDVAFQALKHLFDRAPGGPGVEDLLRVAPGEVVIAQELERLLASGGLVGWWRRRQRTA